jgi:hypothetical protein
VRLQGGAYKLIVGKGQTGRSHDLPATFVASVPFGPKRASELQRQLTIAEKRVHRALSTVEKNRRKEGDDQQVPGLYKTSILFSPEYEIRPEGGRRGPLYLADLLRKADGSYVAFNQPIAIAGFRLELLKASAQTGGLNAAFRVRFCGLVAAGSHLLAFGFAEQTLRFGSFRVELRGEFRLAVGDIATVNIPGATAIAPNSMTFTGAVLLRDGSRELLSGEATASIGPEAGVTTIRLTTRVHVEWGDEFEVGEVKLLKAWVSADFDVSLELGRTLEASLDTGITVHYAFGEFDTDIIDVGFRVCIPMTDICWTENKQIEVIDFSDMDWGDEHTISGRLELDLKSSVSGAAFSGTLTANIPKPGGGTFPLNATLASFAL